MNLDLVRTWDPVTTYDDNDFDDKDCDDVTTITTITSTGNHDYYNA